MAHYVYPALFAKEKAGYAVSFPDLDNVFTSGTTLQETITMAEDALSLMLSDMEESGLPIPKASDAHSLDVESDQIVIPVSCDTGDKEFSDHLR